MHAAVLVTNLLEQLGSMIIFIRLLQTLPGSTPYMAAKKTQWFVEIVKDSMVQVDISRQMCKRECIAIDNTKQHQAGLED